MPPTNDIAFRMLVLLLVSFVHGYYVFALEVLFALPFAWRRWLSLIIPNAPVNQPCVFSDWHVLGRSFLRNVAVRLCPEPKPVPVEQGPQEALSATHARESAA